jgi:hypothetical protein
MKMGLIGCRPELASLCVAEGFIGVEPRCACPRPPAIRGRESAAACWSKCRSWGSERLYRLNPVDPWAQPELACAHSFGRDFDSESASMLLCSRRARRSVAPACTSWTRSTTGDP